MKTNLHFEIFRNIEIPQVIEKLPCIRQAPLFFILHSHQYGCCCPDNVRSQGISINGIHLYCMEESGLSTKRVNSLSGEPDYFGRNKILSGYDLSHYQVPHCIRVFFYYVWFVFIHHNFQFYFKYVPIVTFWIFTYHKIWILLIIFCFIWSYWIIYFSTSLEVFWSVVS